MVRSNTQQKVAHVHTKKALAFVKLLKFCLGRKWHGAGAFVKVGSAELVVRAWPRPTSYESPKYHGAS
jgi:hypothetical protein